LNPFTDSLLQKIDNPALRDFVRHWDLLEELVIDIYRGLGADSRTEKVYRHLRTWLLTKYPGYRSELRPHWLASKIGRKPPQGDPFMFLLSHTRAAAFIGNWRAMQTLPAAREAINQMLIDRIEGD
jgi:hypothetical protein